MSEERPLIEDAREFHSSMSKAMADMETLDKQLTSIFIQSMMLVTDAGRLYEENERLKETVRMLVFCMNDGDCDQCAMNGKETELCLDERRFDGCDGLMGLLHDVGIKIGE